jgi:nitrogen fixation protein NifU and related proteins
MSPYGDVIREHSRHPRNFGSLEAPDIRHEEENPLCGDRVRIELLLDAAGTVSAARFQGDLCIIAKAAASLLTEMIHGMTLDRVRELQEEEMLAALRAEIPPARRKCALLPLDVLRAGVA